MTDLTKPTDGEQAPAPQWNAPAGNSYAPPAAAPVVVPKVAWLVPVSALLAVVGVFIPWFDPSGIYHGKLVLKAASPLHAWEDGKVGLLAPILLVVLSISIVGMLRGQSPARFNRGKRGPVVAAARATLVIGVVAGACVGIAFAFVTSQFKVPSDAGGSWDGAKKLGIVMSYGVQAGWFLTAAAAVLAIIAGVAMLVASSKHKVAGA